MPSSLLSSRSFLAVRSSTAFAIVLLGAAACSDGADSGGTSGRGVFGGVGGAAGAGEGQSGGSGHGSAGSGGVSTGQCPPVGPYGTNPGEVAADVTIFDCEGNPVALHALCELKGAFVYTFAPWCPACTSYASSGAPQETYAKYKGDSFDMYFIVTATTGKGVLPTKETCAGVREKYGLQMKVLFDPDGVTSSQLNMKINSGDLVLTRGAAIKINTADHDAVDEALADVFGY